MSMYNRLLKTFVAVIDAGSFTKASGALHMSSTAVMKQLNTLENEMELKLLERSSSGVRTTPAGAVVYRDAKKFFEASEKTLTEARLEESRYATTFCIGASLLYPAKAFIDLWYQLNHDFPDYKLHLVPFDDDHNGIVAFVAAAGEKFDFLMGVCDSAEWLERCNFLKLGDARKMVAVHRSHPLAKKKKLKLSDLHGQTLMMVPEGDSEHNNRLRRDLVKNHPQIKIEDTAQYYDVSVFNRCAETGHVLLTLDCWQHVRPDLVTLPVEWDYTIPYGLVYAKNPLPDVAKFVAIAADFAKRGSSS